MSSSSIPYGKLVDKGDGTYQMYLTQEKIEAYVRMSGATVDVVGKICDFCQADLPVSHETQKCRRQGCNTMYDTCAACAEMRKANKKYAYCFKDHMRKKVGTLMYGESYNERWGMDDCSHNSVYLQEEGDGDETHEEKYPPIKITSEMFKGRMKQVQPILDAMIFHELEVTLDKPEDGIGTLMTVKGPADAAEFPAFPAAAREAGDKETTE